MRRTFLTLASILLPCASLAAPSGTLVVRVRDPQGAAVAEARATLVLRTGEIAAVRVTDRDGCSRIAGLAAGPYLVTVEADGFSAFGPRRVRIAMDDTVHLDADLALGGVHEQLVVTASDSAQAIGEVSKSVSVIDRVEMDARGDVALADVLRAVPGLRVQQLGGPGSFTTVATRGMRPQDTALLIDGVRFRDPSGAQGDASAFLQDFVTTDLDRVEVLRGSASSLYGSHAIGGVVHLLSAAGAGPTRGHVLLEGGSLGLLRSRGDLSGGLAHDRVSYSVGATRLNVSRGIDGHDRADNTSVQGRVRVRLLSNASLLVRVYGADAVADVNETPQTIGVIPPGIQRARALSQRELERYEAGTPVSQLSLDGADFISSANDPDERRESLFASGLLRFEHRLSSALGYSVVYQRLATKRVYSDGPLGVSAYEPAALARYEYRGRTETLATRVDLALGTRHLMTAGYELEDEDLDDRSWLDDPSANSTANVSQRSHSFFVQEQTRLFGDRLQLAGGGRVQLFRLSTPRFAPAASAPYQGQSFEAPAAARTLDGSVAYTVGPTSLRAHVGAGYRAPSLFERFGSGYSTYGYSIFGDPRLVPERSIGVDATVERSLARGRMRVSATYFHTRLRDTIVFDYSGALDPSTDPFGRSAGYRTVGTGRASGAELIATAAPSPSSRLSLSYTFVDSAAPAGVREATRALGVPRHQVSFVGLVGLQRALTASVQLVAMSDVQAQIGSRVLSFDATLKADAQLSYRVPLGSGHPVRLTARVENPFDTTYFENGFRTPGRTVACGATFAF